VAIDNAAKPKITDMRLSNRVAVGANMYKVDLNLYFQTTESSQGFAFNRKIPIFFQTDAAGAITGCVSGVSGGIANIGPAAPPSGSNKVAMVGIASGPQGAPQPTKPTGMDECPANFNPQGMCTPAGTSCYNSYGSSYTVSSCGFDNRQDGGTPE
jgi:hypothetical protein